MTEPDTPRRPRINDRVHYVSYGTPGGEYPSTCRAATVTAVQPVKQDTWAQAEIESLGYVPYEADLFVMNPSGTFHNRCWQDETHNQPGTWHWDCEDQP